MVENKKKNRMMRNESFIFGFYDGQKFKNIKE